MAIKISSKPLLFVATATVVATAVGGYAWYEEHRVPVLEIRVFALKTGNSIFIRTPDDKRILIDGGSNSEVIRHLTDVLPFYSRRIDMIISTTHDPRTVTGLIDVAERYDISQVYVPKYTLESMAISDTTDQRAFLTFLETLERKDVDVREVSAGDQIACGEEVTAQVLFPLPPEDFVYSRASAPEVLLHIIYRSTSFVFMGNASKKIQNFLTFPEGGNYAKGPDYEKRPDIIGVDALILSHGATAGTLSLEFMNKLRPGALIYERVPARKGGDATHSSAKKLVADPLASIMRDQRYNLREGGSVHIISDGKKSWFKR